jgi:hypothetical protein
VRAAGPLRGPQDQKEAASPPLSFLVRRAGYGAAPPASRVLRIALRATNAASLALSVSRQLVWVRFGFGVVCCPVKAAELL